MRHRNFNTKGLSLSAKLVLSLSAIAVMLTTTAVISVLEYRSMSHSVSSEIGRNIDCINVSQDVAVALASYNHQILTTVGAADSLGAVTSFDRKAAAELCSKEFDKLGSVQPIEGLDSLRQCFEQYIQASEALDTVVRSTFVDSRRWFFYELQPEYSAFMDALKQYNENVHLNLMAKADEFEITFYRSIVPGIVSVLAGLLLIALLLFFLMSNYVKPIYRMLGNLEDYLKRGKKYSYDFEGDDQLRKLNSQITELADENTELKRRVKELKEKV